jgi:hypothetical protein
MSDTLTDATVFLLNRQIQLADNYAAKEAKGYADVLAPPVAPPEVIPDVPPVAIEPAAATHPAAGGTGAVAVTITGPGTSGTWIVDKQAEAVWIDVVSPLEPMAADGTITYNVAANLGGARMGFMYINGKTYTVNQEGYAGTSVRAAGKPGAGVTTRRR